MNNAFVHLELNTTDLDQAKAFYAGLFQWKMEDMDMGAGGTYVIIKPETGPGGGMMKHPVPGAPSSWLAYVDVENVQAATEKAKSLGAQVMKDVTEVPERGWFTVILDPTGAPLALWQTKHK